MSANPVLRIRSLSLSCKSLSAKVIISLAVLELTLTKFSFRNEFIVRLSVLINKSWRSPMLVEDGWGNAYLGSKGNEETFLGYICSSS